MHCRVTETFLAALLTLCFGAVAAVFPGASWEKAAPESLGVSTQALKDAPQSMTTPIGNAIVIRAGYDVYHYGDAYSATYHTASCVRSYLATMYGVAIREGEISMAALDEPVANLGTPAAKKFGTATLLKHLLSYSACSNPPGTGWQYGCQFNPMCEILMELYGTDMEKGMVELTNSKLLPVIGGKWSAVYWTKTQHPSCSYFRIRGTLEGLARWGWLMLHEGRWGDTQLIDSAFVERAISPLPKPGGGFVNATEGWQIHLNRGAWKGLPDDSYAALGNGAESVIWVCPSLEMVVARFGAQPQPSDAIHSFLKPIADAVVADLVPVAHGAPRRSSASCVRSAPHALFSLQGRYVGTCALSGPGTVRGAKGICVMKSGQIAKPVLVHH